MKISKFLTLCLLLLGCMVTSCNNNNEDNVSKINEALANEDYVTAYGIVDNIYSNDNNDRLVAPLNKKIVMAECGAIIESDMETKNKAARLILIVEERSRYNNWNTGYPYGYVNSDGKKEEMYNTLINIADVQGDTELKSLLEKAKDKLKNGKSK